MEKFPLMLGPGKLDKSSDKMYAIGFIVVAVIYILIMVVVFGTSIPASLGFKKPQVSSSPTAVPGQVNGASDLITPSSASSSADTTEPASSSATLTPAPTPTPTVASSPTPTSVPAATATPTPSPTVAPPTPTSTPTETPTIMPTPT